MPTFNYSSVYDFTIENAVSLYLYGTEAPPNSYKDRLRENPDQVTVVVDASSFMSGPGKYAMLCQMPLAKILFGGGVLGSIDRAWFDTNVSGNSYSVAHLLTALHLDMEIFQVATNQYQFEPMNQIMIIELTPGEILDIG